MAFSSDPRHDSYDAVVAGAGLGGLTAAAFLARAGRKVLLLERQDAPGGYAHAFQRGPYTFDPAIHITAGTDPGELIPMVLSILGVADRCSFIELEHLCSAHFPDLHFHAPAGLEEFIDAHARAFPQEADAIRRFFKMCEQLTRESQQLPPQLSLQVLDQYVAKFPLFFRYRTATLADVLDEYLTDPRAKALVSSTWPYAGLAPSRLSFYTWSATLNLLLKARYCKGSFQQLVDALAAALEMHGGELVIGAQVDRILVADGKVTGVALSGGRQIQTPVVVSNLDAPQTFERLVGLERLPVPYARKLRRMTMSLSAFALFMATRLDLRRFEARHENFVYKHWDHEQTQRDILSGKPGGLWFNIPTLADPSLAPPGEHLMIYTSLAPRTLDEPWEKAKERYQEAMLADLEAIFPGFRDSVTYLESATPETFARYSNCEQAPIYGWANTPAQAGSQRLDLETPIAGLYLAGQWAQPGTGSTRVIYSGALCVQRILRYPTFGEFLQGVARG